MPSGSYIKKLPGVFRLWAIKCLHQDQVARLWTVQLRLQLRLCCVCADCWGCAAFFDAAQPQDHLKLRLCCVYAATALRLRRFGRNEHVLFSCVCLQQFYTNELNSTNHATRCFVLYSQPLFCCRKFAMLMFDGWYVPNMNGEQTEAWSNCTDMSSSISCRMLLKASLLIRTYRKYADGSSSSSSLTSKE